MKINLFTFFNRPGATVTVTDTSDLDWWQGKCYGNSGYFPSKYVAKLHPGERPLIMMATIQVSDGETGMIKLLRDQVLIELAHFIPFAEKIASFISPSPPFVRGHFSSLPSEPRCVVSPSSSSVVMCVCHC